LDIFVELFPRRDAAREILVVVSGSSWICVEFGILRVPHLLIVVRRGYGWKKILGFGLHHLL